MQTDKIHVEYIQAKHWWQSPSWKLLKEYKSANGRVTVPVDFVTDGASIPSLLRGYFSPVGRYFGAAIVHDFLVEACPQPTSRDDWKTGNDEFKHELKALNITAWRLWVVLNGVRAWAVINTEVIDKLPWK